MLHFKKLLVWVLVLLMAFAAVGCSTPNKENTDVQSNPIMEQYPTFFGLDTANGLTVYVTSFAQGTYSCSLFPTGQVDTDSPELWNAGSVDLSTMKEILALYALPAEAITVVPYQSLLSSYIAVELMQDGAAAWLRAQLGLGEMPEEEEVMGPEDVTDAPFPYALCWAGNAEDGENALRYTYYPITGTYTYKNELTYVAIGIKNQQELDSFLSLANKYFSLNASISNTQPFNSVAKSYDEAFFQEKGLVVVYIPSDSLSIRYRLGNALLDGEELHITVTEKRSESDPSSQTAGWFMAVELPQTTLAQANYFSAGK